MRLIFKYIILLLLTGINISLSGQGDTERPAAPILTFVTVQPETGKTLMNWISSSSADVAGYVIYYLKNGEAFAVDTIRDPYSVQYLNIGSFSSYLSESYVIAAIDSSKNISPLSNELHTIFTTARIDSCNKKIIISWNKYNSSPNAVTGYRILSSENGGSFTEAGATEASVNSLTINNFSSNSTYCFETVAILDGGFFSYSNKTCIRTGLQRAPDWINADFATVDDKNVINLSFSVDPVSEISTYRLERKSGDESDFREIVQISSLNNVISYSDKTADPFKINKYRLLAINNCGIAVVASNLSSNIVPKIEKEGNNLLISWNPYKFWLGEVSDYHLFINEGVGFHEFGTVPPSDSSLTINYASIMYNITNEYLCFKVGAYETGNPYGINGETHSVSVCTEIIEKITVPNTFTPNDDLVNDFFKPVLSFTPADYYLIITNRKNATLFESHDWMAGWDGKQKGESAAQGVYLWYLRVKTPSGKLMTRSGTVTIIK